MYCKKCGKVIPDDSFFCQHCGEQINDSWPLNKQEGKGLINRFQSLSKGWQICLMLYVCWVFLWIILCVTEAIYEDEQGFYILLFVFVLPILALFVWYFFARLMHKGKEDLNTDIEQPLVVQQPSTQIIESEYLIWPLLQFASLFGKMQVKVETDSDGNSSSYCVFTNANGDVSRVEFGSATQGMRASDISNKKDRLYIVQIPGPKYQLIEL